MKELSAEDKELLLKDLCVRLPYNVKAYVKNWSKLDQKYYEDTYDVKSVFPSLNEVHVQSKSSSVDVILGYYDYDIKPFLFPLSSMTEEQYNEFFSYYHNIEMDEIKASGDYLKAAYLGENAKHDWLNKNHFDYHYLIERNLAIDCTNLNIY